MTGPPHDLSGSLIRWHLKSFAINEVVEADDQWEAWDTLSERPLEDFGLIVMAEPNETP